MQAHIYYQAGQDAFGKLIDAKFASVYLQYAVQKKVNIGWGCDFLSGKNAKKTSTKNQSFNTLYATNHKYYGHMDYFVNVPKYTKGAGLIDVYLKSFYKVNEKGSISLDMHYFMLGNNLNDPNNAGAFLKRNLGFETDLFGSIKPADFCEIKLGYSHMFGTPSLENLAKVPNATHNTYSGWAWVQLNVTPTFFKHPF